MSAWLSLGALSLGARATPAGGPPERGPGLAARAGGDSAPRSLALAPGPSASKWAPALSETPLESASATAPTLLRQDAFSGRSKLGAWVTLGSGVAAVVVGGVLYGLSAGRADAANRASDDGDPSAYERHLDAYELERGFSWGLLSVGTAAIGVGALMLLLDDEDAARVVAAPAPATPTAPEVADGSSLFDVEVRSVHVRPVRRGGLLSMRGRF